MSVTVSKQPQTRVQVRWALRRDLPAVLAIENASFEFPWSEDDFLLKMSQRDCVSLVAEYGEQIVGFVIYEFGDKAIRLISLCVHPDFRRQGVGRQMVARLVSKLSSRRR